MKTSKLLAWIVSAAVLVVVVTGFFLAGSPAEERARRFDQQRVNDLQMMTNAVDQFYNAPASRRLPVSLEELRAQPNTYLPALTDPESGEAYGYRKIDEKRYEVCATFKTDATRDENGMLKPVSMARAPAPYPDFWTHPEGRKCYEVTVNDWTPAPMPVK